MGYFLLFESMLDTVIYARDRWLCPGGKILPDRCNISLAGIGDEGLHASYVSYWDNVYGFHMSCMKSAVVQEASIQVVKPEKIITDACVIKVMWKLAMHLDVTSKELNFQRKSPKPRSCSIFAFSIKVFQRYRILVSCTHATIAVYRCTKNTLYRKE